MNGISGSELYLLQLLPFLRSKGIEVEMLIAFKEKTGKNDSFVNQLSSKEVLTHEIYGHKPFSLVLIKKINNIIKNGKFDIVQGNLIHADFWLAISKLIFGIKAKLISVKHGFDENYSAQYGFDIKHLNRSLFVWVQRFSGFFFAKNITISRGIYDLYVKGRITKATKTKIVYYGLDLKHIQNSGFTRLDNSQYAIILGRLVKYKGHEMVIKAWTEIKKINPQLKLYIVGSGEYEANLKNVVNELELHEQVIFCGYTPDPHSLLHFAEFSIVSSIFEGFGLITLESWYHKKPVIAFNVPALNEIINDGVNGILVEKFDQKSLSNSIMKMFNEKDNTLSMGEAGFKKLHGEYSLQRMANEMILEYNSLLK